MTKSERRSSFHQPFRSRTPVWTFLRVRILFLTLKLFPRKIKISLQSSLERLRNLLKPKKTMSRQAQNASRMASLFVTGPSGLQTRTEISADKSSRSKRAKLDRKHLPPSRERCSDARHGCRECNVSCLRADTPPTPCGAATKRTLSRAVVRRWMDSLFECARSSSLT